MTKKEINQFIDALKEAKAYKYEHAHDYMGGYKVTLIYLEQKRLTYALYQVNATKLFKNDLF